MTFTRVRLPKADSLHVWTSDPVAITLPLDGSVTVTSPRTSERIPFDVQNKAAKPGSLSTEKTARRAASSLIVADRMTCSHSALTSLSCAVAGCLRSTSDVGPARISDVPGAYVTRHRPTGAAIVIPR
jgi:hypothetical protein